jgi:hypothetical protein
MVPPDHSVRRIVKQPEFTVAFGGGADIGLSSLVRGPQCILPKRRIAVRRSMAYFKGRRETLRNVCSCTSRQFAATQHFGAKRTRAEGKSGLIRSKMTPSGHCSCGAAPASPPSRT